MTTVPIRLTDSLHSLQPPRVNPRTVGAIQKLKSREGTGSLFHAHKNLLRHALGKRAR